eukprot:5144053-Pyramimonas_sp.AAC.1
MTRHAAIQMTHHGISFMKSSCRVFARFRNGRLKAPPPPDGNHRPGISLSNDTLMVELYPSNGRCANWVGGGPLG